MSEPNISYSKKLVEIFLNYYNAEHKTSFKWVDNKSYQAESPSQFDFVVFDNDKELGIQHTRATSDPVREFIKPKLCDRVIDQLRRNLLANHNLPNLSIYINFYNPPKDKKDIKEILWWLEYFITEKVTSSLGPNFYSYTADFDEQFLPVIKKYINNLEIAPLRRNIPKNISFMYGYSKTEPEPWPDDAQRIIKAVEAKENECKDTLLLVESGWSGVSDNYLPEIKETLKPKKLKEVWIVEPFFGRERAVKIK